MAGYIGVDGIARKIKSAYIGVDGVARKVVKAYVGDENGKAKLVYSAKFEDQSWEQIIAACQSGSVPSSWEVGDTKPMTINGTEYNIRIIGKDHDQYADGSGTAPLTFQLEELYGTKYAMSSLSSSIGYAGTDMCYETLPSILALMPSAVQSGIKAVTKGYDGAQSWSCSADLFLLSEYEVFGAATYASQAPFDKQYDFYANGGSPIKDYAWWLRNNRFSDDTRATYCAVYNGNPNFYVQTSRLGVSFAFCF